MTQLPVVEKHFQYWMTCSMYPGLQLLKICWNGLTLSSHSNFSFAWYQSAFILRYATLWPQAVVLPFQWFDLCSII